MSDDFSDLDKRQIARFGNLVGMMALMALAIMVLGSLVRANDAGLSCPDWPLCYDRVVPFFDFRIFVEWFHRLLAGLLSLVAIYVVVRLLREKVLRRVFGYQIAAAAIVLIVQVILGGLTVLKLLDPKIVSLHLINALVFVSLLIWVFVKSRVTIQPEHYAKAVHPMVKYSYTVLSVLIFSQVLLGGMVSSNHAGLACPDFPTCHGSWWPEASFLVWLQLSHRYVAFTILALILLISGASSITSVPKTLRIAARLLPTLVVLQIALGIANIQWLLPEWASVSHAANAHLLFITSLSATLVTYYCDRGFAEGKVGTSKETSNLLVNPTIVETNS